MSVQTKPPTQVAGVQGFSAFEAKPGMPVKPLADWRRLVTLPPFQMFVADKGGLTGGDNSEELAKQYVTYKLAAGEEAAMLLQYEQWHEAKGLWPNETPHGDVRAEA